MTAPVLPEVRYDQDRAREWVEAQCNDNPEVVDGIWVPALGSDAGWFLAAAEQVVTEADAAQVFGEDVSVGLALSCDSEGVMDGAFVFVSRAGEESGPFLRLSSLHQEHADLTTAGDDAEGRAAALGVLEAVAATAYETVEDARKALGL